LIEIGSKTAEKNCTNTQTDKPTDTTKIMVTWPWTNYYYAQLWRWHMVTRHRPVLLLCLGTDSDPHLHFASLTQWVTETAQR